MDDVISLGIGEPDFVTPPNILAAGIASLERGETAYTSNAGLFELRAAISRMLSEQYGASPYNPDTEVLVTVGVSEAMHLVFQALLNPGDEVIVPQPCFVSYTANVLLAGGRVIDIPLSAETHFRLLPEHVESVITPRTKVLLIGYPNNPTGAVMDKEDLLRIAKVVEKYACILEA